MSRLLVEPFRAGYMQRALVEALLVGALGGAIGVYVVLRRLAFVTETLQHTIFPGMAAAFVLGESLFLGALVTGGASAFLLAVLGRHRRVEADTALAILLTSFFALGVVLVSRTPSYTGDLSVLLFGQVLSVDRVQIVRTLWVAATVGALLVALHKELVLVAFDREGAEAQGYPVARIDLALNLAIALVVVSAVETVGTVLVTALVVVPAAAARLLSDRVVTLLGLSCAIGALSGWAGLVVSYESSVHHGLRLASGASIVVVLSAVFVVALGVSRLRARSVRLPAEV